MKRREAALPPRPEPSAQEKRRVRLSLVRPDVPTPGIHDGRELSSLAKTSSVRSDLTAQQETFGAIMQELPPLFKRHWEELALNRDTIPLDPDWQRYMAMDVGGVLKITTARCGNTLAGYIFNLVNTHLHYRSTLFANIEMFWLDPAYRGGTFAVKWFRQNDKMLRDMGVQKIVVTTKNHYMAGRVGSVFRRLGYKPIETVWSG